MADCPRQVVTPGGGGTFHCCEKRNIFRGYWLGRVKLSLTLERSFLTPIELGTGGNG